MKQSIRVELEHHLLALISDGVLTLDNVEDWHFHAFNEDYYIIGYYNAEQWLERHGVSAFDAIETIKEYEQSNFGEVSTRFDNAESVVNMYVYILGEELLADIQEGLIQELEERV